MSQRDHGVEDEIHRLKRQVSVKLQRGELSIDEADAARHLLEQAAADYQNNDIDRREAFDALHRAEAAIQEEL